MLISEAVLITLKQLDSESWLEVMQASVILFCVVHYLKLAKAFTSADTDKDIGGGDDDDLGNLNLSRYKNCPCFDFEMIF
jgi:hypothetical protein